MFLDLDIRPKKSIALKDNEGYCLTYGALVEEVKGFYNGLKSRAVAFILCKNTVGSMLGYLSFVENEIVPLMLSSKIDSELLNTLFITYTPAYLWVPEEQTDKYDGNAVFSKFGYTLLETGNQPYPIHEQLQLLMTTSGSTGSPKLVRYKKGNLEANAKNVASAFGWNEQERPVCDLGMQYTMGLNVINTHLYVGATVLLTTHNLMSANFWDYIKNEKATNFTGVPFSYDIFARLHFEKLDLPYLKTLSQGGGKLTDKRFTWLAEYAQQNDKRFLASFGTTETSARMCVLPAEYALSKTGSIGKAIPEGELFLIDSDGTILTDPLAEGEMCYKGPNVTMGYGICRDDLNKGDEWQGVYHTGDLARRDEDGCYYVTGRLSRFLKLLSYRVSLDQCERLIQERFNTECACTGIDQRMEIYITDESLVKNVQDFVCDKTGLYKTLFKVHVIDIIPRNDSGKIRYRELG
jgi:acyl-coenzyme A synthetase/AMP-(fatty) acid ligase